MSARKPDAVLFQFNNGTTAIETDLSFIENIRRHLEEDETETTLFARTPADVQTLLAAIPYIEICDRPEDYELAAKLRELAGEQT